MIEILAQITGKDRKGRAFCAGLVLWDDRVVEAAPIVRQMLKGRPRDQVREICLREGWRISVVHRLERERP